MKALLTTVFFCASFGLALAQAPASTATRAPLVAGRSECTLAVGLCVTIPTTWRRMGDIFDNLGFVVAEPLPEIDSATWPQLTVAAIDVPPPKDPQRAAPAGLSLDALVDLVLTPDGSFTSAETLQRTHLILNRANAEIVRVLLHNDADKPAAIEEIALIEGDQGLVYSIALRCTPQDFPRLDAVFHKAAHSWRIKPTQSAAPSKPLPELEKK